MTAPVPYSPSTKFATQIGTCWPVNGIDREPARAEAFLLDLAGEPRAAVLAAERRPRPRASPPGRADSAARRSSSSCSGASSTKVAPKMVSMRVVKTSMSAPVPGAGRIDQREPHARALGPPDPVALHREDLLGPVLEAVDGAQQFVGVVGDPEEPLLQVAVRHQGVAPPAAALDDLLVGEHGLARRAPVDRRPAAVRQVALEHPQEQPLVPLVVVRQARGELALPGVADAQALELALHVGDVRQRGRPRMDAVLDGRVLGRQAEGVPAERVQHVEAAHPLRARHHVADHVVADVADVGVPRRVGEHLEAVELGLRRVFGHLERAAVPPPLLPLLLDGLRVVLAHILYDYSPRQNADWTARARPRRGAAAPGAPLPRRTGAATPRRRRPCAARLAASDAARARRW